jgi:O-antigen ligase
MKWQQIRIKDLLGWLIIFFLFWVVISVAWSQDILVSFRKLLVLGGFWFAAAIFAAHSSFKKITKFAFFYSLILLTVGIVAEVIRNRFQLSPFRWDYWFLGEMQPSMQPQVCAILLIAGTVIGRKGNGRCWRYYAIAGFALFFLFLTRSRTYLYGSLFIALAFMIMTTTSGARLRHVMLHLPALLAGLCFLYLVLGDNLGELGEALFLLGRSPDSTYTLTGRVDLWEISLGEAMNAPLLGHGYGSFVGAKGMIKISRLLEWGAPNPHNGYIEMLLEVGLVGGLAYLLVLVFGLLGGYKTFRKSGAAEHGFALCLLLLYSVAMVFLGFTTNFLLFIAQSLLIKIGFVDDSKWGVYVETRRYGVGTVMSRESFRAG